MFLIILCFLSLSVSPEVKTRSKLIFPPTCSQVALCSPPSACPFLLYFMSTLLLNLIHYEFCLVCASLVAVAQESSCLYCSEFLLKLQCTATGWTRFKCPKSSVGCFERVNRELSQRLLYQGQWIFEVVNRLFDVEPIVMDQLHSMVKLGPKKGLTPNKLYTVFFS